MNSTKHEENKNIQKATFAGGCFWCMEPPYEKLEGVIKVESGYSGGDEVSPTYEQVSAGETEHLEAVQILFDVTKLNYKDLVELYWQQVDPTDAGGQFADRGRQYMSAIFYHDDQQKQVALESMKALAASGRFDQPIVTKLLPYKNFYAAEDYHQDYYKTNPLRYKFYRQGSGRDQFLKSVWDDKKLVDEHMSPKPDLKKKLTPLQYHVTQEGGTERPFNNEFWDNKREGIYVDVVTGEPLFSSMDKFDSGTGWPSFVKPISEESVMTTEDSSLFMQRTEVRGKGSDAHLGHVFPDGPGPTGMRYCINSASLKFIPREDLEKEGYGRFKGLFE